MTNMTNKTKITLCVLGDVLLLTLIFAYVPNEWYKGVLTLIVTADLLFGLPKAIKYLRSE
jgi:hypothetical protein